MWELNIIILSCVAVMLMSSVGSVVVEIFGGGLFSSGLYGWNDDKNGSIYRPDYTYSEKAKGWLKLHRAPVNFDGAFLRCKAEGAIVASPLTEIMRSEMIDMMETAKLQTCGIYTGIQATLATGVFTSLEGVPLESIPAEWAPGEPDNFQNGENCMLMTINGSLADVSCNDTYSFMCYKEYTEYSISQNICGTFDKEYRFDSRTGSCYKFHKLGRSWSHAFMHCVSEGAHLAIINSVTESKVIKELFERFPESTIDANVRGAAAIGFYRKQELRLWYTVHGQTLKEAGFDTFANGQPDNDVVAEGGSFCGAVFRSGLLDDVACRSFTLPYICETHPDINRNKF